MYLLISKRVGDCEIEWADGYLKIEEHRFEEPNQVFIKFAIPIRSVGKQQCILIDLIGRIHPEGDKYCAFENHIYVYPNENRRGDGYWEATLIKPKDTLICRGEITLKAKNTPIREALYLLEEIKVDLYYKYYCRNLLKYERKVVSIPVANLDGVIKVEKKKIQTVDKGEKVLPIKTPLLTPKYNIYDVFFEYVKPHIKEKDIFVICESALAIMEGRVYYVEDIKPGFLATHLNKLFKMDSSLSSPYSLEMAIREVGSVKIIMSIIVGGLGRLVGRSGDFYAFAGREVATIDDCTGTLPPFDKYVVMGPKNPKKTVEEFKKKTGFEIAVVDVNDLGKVDVLALSDPHRKDEVVEALRTNPQGNANEQTPIAIIRG